MDVSTPAIRKPLASIRRSTLRSTAAVIALSGSLLTLAAADAHADVTALRPLDPTLGFTVFVQGDTTVIGNENDGSMALGGDLSIPAGANYKVGNNHPGRWTATGDARPTSLYVGGAAQFGGGLVMVNGGNFAHVVDPTGASVVPNGGVTHVRPLAGSGGIDVQTSQPAASVLGPVGNPIDFASAFDALGDNSAAIARCEPTVELTNANGAPIDWAGDQLNVYVSVIAGRTNVLNLTKAQLLKIDTITFRNGVPDDASLLVNVTDWVSGEWRAPNFSGIGDVQARRVLINFPVATQLTFVPNSRTVEGTILAPGADVTIDSSSNIEGAVVVDELAHVGGGEIHDRPFEQTISCDSPDERDPDERDPDERDPDERDPDERDPDERDPDERDPDERDPDERDPDERDPDERDPDERDPDERDPDQRDPDERDPDQREPEQREPEQRQPEQRQPETPQVTPPTVTPTVTPSDTTPDPEPEAARRTPRGDVKGTARSGGPKAAARISGTVGCVKGAARAKVSGRQLRTIAFRLNGRRLGTLRVTGRRSAGVRIPGAKLASGPNTLTARVTFTGASRAKPKTLRLSFVRCATGAVKPQYTG